MTEVVDTTGSRCPICIEPFKDGVRVAVLGCGGGHLVCEECCDLDTALCVDEYNDTYAYVCPLCRRSVVISQVCLAMNYAKGKGTSASPIVIP